MPRFKRKPSRKKYQQENIYIAVPNNSVNPIQLKQNRLHFKMKAVLI